MKELLLVFVVLPMAAVSLTHLKTAMTADFLRVEQENVAFHNRQVINRLQQERDNEGSDQMDSRDRTEHSVWPEGEEEAGLSPEADSK